jgi:hypothetical protein
MVDVIIVRILGVAADVFEKAVSSSSLASYSVAGIGVVPSPAFELLPSPVPGMTMMKSSELRTFLVKYMRRSQIMS